MDEPTGLNQWESPIDVSVVWYLVLNACGCLDHRFSKLGVLSCVLDVWGWTHAFESSQSAHDFSTVFGPPGHPPDLYLCTCGHNKQTGQQE